MQKRWDIFCSVIDNFGDAGVCWRLARQLAAEYDLDVRLWVDDLAALQRLHPTLHSDADEQFAAGVCVRRWCDPLPPCAPADVVIEAFACTLPSVYVEAMARRERAPVWLNLEYLSAEAWVQDCHGLPSPQPNGLDKYFFFPGFTDATGGLLAERDLMVRRAAFQADAAAQAGFLAGLGVERPAGGRLLSLFAYDSAPVAGLFDALAAAAVPTLCLIPEGRIVPVAARYFGVDRWSPGARHTRGALAATVIPFLDQDAYDRLLWCCDLNCVRGEDSFVRAQWAARPLFWHIYPQADGAHWPKLEAFLALYRQCLPDATAALLEAGWRAWNGDGDMRATADRFIAALPALRVGAAQWAGHLRERANLAAALVQFCANHV